MSTDVLHLADIGLSHAAHAGGKGARLGELSHIDGVRVPDGFCVTTAAYRRVMAAAPSLRGALDELSAPGPRDRDAIQAVTADARRAIESTVIPDDLASAITRALRSLGDVPYAVRSSATAEDMPTASFAGQQDSFLNVVGADAVLRDIRRCWASLFTERAVIYRMQNGIDHRSIAMAVVVQRMLSPSASGVLFTADPVTGNRRVSAVEAVPGLGDALVSGTVTPDVYRIRAGNVISGTMETGAPVSDAQILRLGELGRRIEAHFGEPQDIEWCLVNDDFHIVQSRPITTLFPIPEVTDTDRHVYVSVGHAQMMTDAMKPLGISMWQLTAGRPMHQAGGRLFVDVTKELSAPASRAMLLDIFGRGDPLVRDAMQSLIDRGDFLPPLPAEPVAPPAPAAPPAVPTLIDADPAIVDELIAHTQASLAKLEREIAAKTGPALHEFIMTDIQEMRRVLFDPESHKVITAGFEAAWWLNEKMLAWLGEKNVVDTLAQSAPRNVTAEMGLALLDVGDVIRPCPDVVAFLEQVDDDDFLDALDSIDGGAQAGAAIRGWLDAYGMRCPGEIDITRPRWSENPSAIIPMILTNVRDFAPGEAKRRLDRGLAEAEKKAVELLDRLRALPGGVAKADDTRRMIDRVRAFSGYREYPKYGMISRYFIYRRSLLQEAARLVDDGVLQNVDDVFFLTMQELQDVIGTKRVDHELVRRRMDEFRRYCTLTPPRVLTSDGEGIHGAYDRGDVPEGALIGLPVSAGIVEGRARVILDIADANLEPGDILVTTWTDPSWTPLFVAIRALVTEVGGQMTHGAVIAREYGLPAVVAVPHATTLIRDGQRIRVNGTDGYIEIID